MVTFVNAQTTIVELQRRLIFTLLWPVAALCKRFQIPLDELQKLARLAYYEELRRGDATQSEIAEIFGTSLRTVVGVSKRYRSDFLSPEGATELLRRLEEALAVGGQTVDSLSEQLGASPDDVRRALTGMLAAGRAQHETVDGEERYRLSQRYQSLVRDDLLSRMDGLKHQLQVLLAAVNQRFLQDDNNLPSTARTLSFVGTPEDVEAMINDLVRECRLRAIDVEESALRAGSHDRYGLTIALAATGETRKG